MRKANCLRERGATENEKEKKENEKELMPLVTE